jgi:hypothetical protein
MFWRHLLCRQYLENGTCAAGPPARDRMRGRRRLGDALTRPAGELLARAGNVIAWVEGIDDRALASTVSRRRDHRRDNDNSPFVVCQIARITQAAAVRSPAVFGRMARSFAMNHN